MSDPGPAGLHLAPSRLRRRLLRLGAFGHAVLAAGWCAALLHWSRPEGWLPWLPAMALLLAAAASLRAARAAHGAQWVRLDPSPDPPPDPPAPKGPLARPINVLDNFRMLNPRRWPRPARAAWRAAVRGAAEPAGPVRLRGARAIYAGPGCIVLQDMRRRLVVWRDATDRDTFRRLAAWARWRTDAR